MKENQLESILLGTASLAGIALPANAQIGEQRYNFATGINKDANYSTVSFQPTIKQDGLLRVTGGVTARYTSGKCFAMICGAQLELNFSQRGWDEKFDPEQGFPSEDSYVRTLNYLEVPFLARLVFGKDRGAQFFINLRPQIGFLLGENEKREGSWKTANRAFNEQYEKRIGNKLDYGIAGGGGIEVRTKVGNFLLEGRYYFGLTDFYNSTKKDYFACLANSTTTTKITYLFDMKK